FQRALKKTVENWPRCAKFMRSAIGLADLAQDFRFAKELGIESGGDAKKMADGIAIIAMIERGAENIGADGVKLAEEGGEPRSRLARSLGRHAVDLAAITS